MGAQQMGAQTDLRSQSGQSNPLLGSTTNSLQIGEGVNVSGNNHSLSSYPMSGDVNQSFVASEIDFLNTEGVATSPQSGMATGNVTPDDTRSGSGGENGEPPNGSSRRVHVSGKNILM